MKNHNVQYDTERLRLVRQIKNCFSGTDGTTFSMRLKLFLLFTLLIISILSGVIIILITTGTLTAGLRETEKDMTIELERFQEDVIRQYGQVAANTVEFSEELSSEIEKNMAARGLTPQDLKTHPELLEPLIEEEYDRSLFAMEKAKGSGVFLILDVTVNPTLEKAARSRSGLYIKNMEPNIISASSDYLLILRGFSNIGRYRSVTLHPQWRMEFDITDADYFNDPIRAAEETDLPLSRLFHWSDAMILPGTAETVMLCSAPLIDSEGNAFGVCGFEISSMLFKLSHEPGRDISQRVICILSPASGKELSLTRAMISGRYSILNLKNQDQDQGLAIHKDEPFNSYRRQDGTLYSGFHHPVSLYPVGSAFEKESWMTALIIPDEDISASVVSLNLKLLALFLALLMIGITLSYYLSRKFMMPFTRGIEIIKSKDYLSRTNAAEIDDLIEFLSSVQTDKEEKDTPGITIPSLPDSIFEEFVRNTKHLSPAERAVFNLYVEGYTAKDITRILCISINTVKTHNKRIYMKLNVASREELLVYVNMLKAAGKDLSQL